MTFVLRLFSFRKKREGNLRAFLKDRLNVKAKDLNLYSLAFRHSSASQQLGKKNVQNNERLEFLGDAILGAVVADYLYQEYPGKDEGFLTSMRSKIVSRKNLNIVADKLGITGLVISKLDKKKPAKSVGGDTLEALIGAIYLDLGIKSCHLFIQQNILKTASGLESLENHIISYKGLLIEWAQKERKQFEFNLIDQWGKQHNMTFEMGLKIDDVLISKGKGASKKRAEEEASRKAFSILKIPV